MSFQPTPLFTRSLTRTMPQVCDICGRARGGTHPVSHEKCSKIRKARGFAPGVAQ